MLKGNIEVIGVGNEYGRTGTIDGWKTAPIGEVLLGEWDYLFIAVQDNFLRVKQMLNENMFGGGARQRKFFLWIYLQYLALIL